MNLTLHIKTLVAACTFVFALGAVLPAQTTADQLTLNLVGGTIISVAASDQKLQWKTIDKNGNAVPAEISLSDIESIVLSDRPASLQIRKVRELLDQLNSDDYHIREKAQTSLIEGNYVFQFKQLFEAELEHESLEVQTRVARILAEAKTSKTLNPIEYDILKMKDGKELQGDGSAISIRCQWNGENLEMASRQLRRVTRVKLDPASVNTESVKTTYYQTPANFDFKDKERYIDFDDVETEDRRNEYIDVSDRYWERGVIFEAEQAGYIGLSGFPFTRDDCPSGENSVTVTVDTGSYPKRFVGISRISFCVPGLPDMPAGVKKFGMVVSRVDNSRDFVMEAYNANSQLLGAVEATDEGSVFLGIESTEPIAFIRVLSNPYLFEVGRKIDTNYAFDAVWFEQPVTIQDAHIARGNDNFAKLFLKDGEVITGEALKLGEKTVSIFDPNLKRKLKFDTSEVKSVRMADELSTVEPTKNTASFLRLPKPTTNHWMALMTNGSIWKLDLKDGLESTFLKQGLPMEEIAALWSSKDQMRLPADGDFNTAPNVLVFPTCRVPTTLEIDYPKISWDKKANKLTQDVFTKPQKKDDRGELVPREDVTPKYYKMNLQLRAESQVPTIWFTPPPEIVGNVGSIRLVDGQRIMLGKNDFQVVSFSDNSLRIKQGSTEIDLPYSEVRTIKFPE